jgi:hypothetical protein
MRAVKASTVCRSAFDQSFEQVRLANSPAVYRAERAIEGLTPPQRLVMLWREVAQPLIGCHLRRMA